MHQSVQASLCDELTLEHIVTISDRKLTGKDECLSAVLVVDYLLKVVLDLIIQLNHPKVIDNQRILVAELAEEVLDFDYASPNGKNIIMRISYFDALS